MISRTVGQWEARCAEASHPALGSPRQTSRLTIGSYKVGALFLLYIFDPTALRDQSAVMLGCSLRASGGEYRN
jgi:hypothetical protein